MCCCGSYENFENVDVIFSWFGIVKIFCSIYMFVGIIVNNKFFVYFVSLIEGLLNRLMVYDFGFCDYKVYFFG